MSFKSLLAIYASIIRRVCALQRFDSKSRYIGANGTPEVCSEIDDDDKRLQGHRRFLGEGTYGNVYKYDTHEGSFAVKISAPHNAQSALEEVSNLLHLSSIIGNGELGQCSFEDGRGCLMRYYGCCKFKNNSVAIFSEYVEGPGNLNAFVTANEGWEHLRTDLKEKYIRAFTGNMVAAISFLHGNFIVHQDLKPDNFVLQENEKLDSAGNLRKWLSVKTIDFGLIRICPSGKCPCTPVGGAPSFMAPEIVNARKIRGWHMILQQTLKDSPMVNELRPVIIPSCRPDRFNLVAARDVFSIGATVHFMYTGTSTLKDSDNMSAEGRYFSNVLMRDKALCRPTLHEIVTGVAGDSDKERNEEICGFPIDFARLKAFVGELAPNDVNDFGHSRSLTVNPFASSGLMSSQGMSDEEVGSPANREGRTDNAVKTRL